MQYTTDQLNNFLNCGCPFHNDGHKDSALCSCGEILPDAAQPGHEDHPKVKFDPILYYFHGDTFEDVFDRLNGYGVLPYGTEEFVAVWNRLP